MVFNVYFYVLNHPSPACAIHWTKPYMKAKNVSPNNHVDVIRIIELPRTMSRC